jgi:hypothetical protein
VYSTWTPRKVSREGAGSRPLLTATFPFLFFNGLPRKNGEGGKKPRMKKASRKQCEAERKQEKENGESHCSTRKKTLRGVHAEHTGACGYTDNKKKKK